MKGSNLGEFEELIMLAIGVLFPMAYGVSIRDEIQNRSGRTVSLSAVHASLQRLEQKGYLESEFGESTQKRGGKRKKFFSITAQGVKTMEEARTLREGMWGDINDFVIQQG
jgi:DNA-binding PadR family transcriptional regulator